MFQLQTQMSELNTSAHFDCKKIMLRERLTLVARGLKLQLRSADSLYPEIGLLLQNKMRNSTSLLVVGNPMVGSLQIKRKVKLISRIKIDKMSQGLRIRECTHLRKQTELNPINLERLTVSNT